MIRSASLAGLALALLVGPVIAQPAAPVIAQPAPATTTNCDGDTGVCTQTTCKVNVFGNTTCVTVTLAAPERERTGPRKDQHQLACEAREGERRWLAYCTPEVYVDAEGVSRYRYGKPDCGGAVLSVRKVRAPWLDEPLEQECRRNAADR
jgi:hypothetical protein